ncbi:MAG TPA: hypothetical protein VLC12_07190 [Terriglobales bacterium]|nr:hypothetical protein [Terriglobales bacterium]
MQEETSTQELKERLDLIERMIREGRRSTENWGWAFVLWGIAFYVALAWANWEPSGAAWPITMVCTLLLTLMIGVSKGKGHPGSSMGRAITCVWMASGVAMLIVFPALSATGRIDQHGFVAVVAAILGLANAASGMILRWKTQLACALVWWAASVAACFGSARELLGLFLAAVFVCQIVFGIYVMICESQRGARSGVAHA